VFAADFETELTTADLTEASPALAGGLAADLLFLGGTGVDLTTGLTAVLTADLALGLTLALVTGLAGALETGLALDLTDTEAAFELDFAAGFTAVLGLGDAAAMVFLMPTDRVISVLFCMECASWHELAQQTLGPRKPRF
jgi:hypothetical protein